MHTHMLINAAGRALYEVTPDARNAYPVADLVALPADYWSPDYAGLWTWAGRVVSQDPAKTEAVLIARVKAEAETRRMAVITRGFGKDQCYQQKGKEAEASANVLTVTLNALTATSLQAQYPAAYIETRLTGEPAATVLTRFRRRRAECLPELLRIEGLEQDACTRIRTAATAAAKRAAYAAINWSWTPA